MSPLILFPYLSHLILCCAESVAPAHSIQFWSNLLPNKNNGAHLPLAKQKWSLMWWNKKLLRGKRRSLWKMSSVLNQDKEGSYLPCNGLCTVMLCYLNLASGQGSWWEVQTLDRSHCNSELIVQHPSHSNYEKAAESSHWKHCSRGTKWTHMDGHVEQCPKQSTNEQSIENNMKQMGSECLVIYQVSTWINSAFTIQHRSDATIKY